MASADVRKVLRVPGRLCAAPTDLSTAFPHGGTALGIVRDLAFRPNLKQRRVTAEEFGGEIVETIIGGESCVLACVLRGMDNDAVTKAFLNTSAGSSSGDRTIQYPGSSRAGTLGSSRSFKLLFSPRDTTNHHGLILYNAIPLVAESAELQLAIGQEMGIAVVFVAYRTSTPNLYQIAKLADMTLSG